MGLGIDGKKVRRRVARAEILGEGTFDIQGNLIGGRWRER
jgi:hypothetical protein